MNEPRAHRLIGQAIRTFNLQLEGLTILTEAATGYYALTPLVAALAGAEHVLALTRDSRYGAKADILRHTLELARRWGVADRITLLDDRTDPRVGEADVVTNLGFVRPLDLAMLDRLKGSVVIPLMWETWEFRAADLCLDECWSRGIPVLGTDEHHPDLDIFPYVGHLALKLALRLDIELHRASVLVMGGGEFAAQAEASLSGAGAETWRWSLASGHAIPAEQIARADAIVVIEHQQRAMLVGPGAPLDPQVLLRVNPGVVIVHVCGGMDVESVQRAGLRYAPDSVAPAGYMSVATDFLGPRPLIDLHTAGLRVGEVMARFRRRGLSGIACERKTLSATALAQGFAGRHD